MSRSVTADQEWIANEHELAQIAKAAKTLEERLELHGWNDERDVVRAIRWRADEAIASGVRHELDGDEPVHTGDWLADAAQEREREQR